MDQNTAVTNRIPRKFPQRVTPYYYGSTRQCVYKYQCYNDQSLLRVSGPWIQKVSRTMDRTLMMAVKALNVVRFR